MKKVIALIVVVFFSGCARNTVSVKSKYDFSKVRRIAVLGFEPASADPTSGEAMGRVFEKLLADAGYELIAQEKVRLELEQRGYKLSGAVNDKKAAEIGKALGVDALIYGSVTVYSPHETAVIFIDINSPEGNHQQPLIYRSEAEAGVTARMVDVNSGQIAWIGSTSEEGTDIRSASGWVGETIVSGLKKFGLKWEKEKKR